jgi:hypothetical protein
VGKSSRNKEIKMPGEDLLNEEQPQVGTNKNIFIYPNMGVIGAYYEADPKTLFDSGLIFNDYEDTKGITASGLDAAVDSQEIDVMFRDNEARNRFYGPYKGSLIGVPADEFYEFDLCIKIYEAWMDTFSRCGANSNIAYPRPRIIDDMGLEFLSNGKVFDPRPPLPDGSRVEYARAVPTTFLTGFPEEAPDNENQLIAAMSPLFHFPPVGQGSWCKSLRGGPVDPDGIMDNRLLFYNNLNRQASQLDLQTKYGVVSGNLIFDKCKSMNRDIYVHELIKSTGRFGYNITTNWALLGWPDLDGTIDFESMGILDPDFFRGPRVSRINPIDYRSTDGLNTKIRQFQVWDAHVLYANPLHFMSSIWSSRDRMIMFFLNGGYIPWPGATWGAGTNREQLMAFDRFWLGRWNGKFYPHLGDMYPIYWRMHLEENGGGLAMFLKILGMIVSMIMGILTGGATLVQTFVNLLKTVVTELFNAILNKLANLLGPSYAGLGMVASGLFGGVMNKYFDIPNANNPGEPANTSSMKYQKAIDFFRNSAISDIKNMLNNPTKKSTMITAMFNFDITATSRQKVNMEMILRHKDARFGHFLDNTDPGTPNGVMLQASEIGRLRSKNIDISDIWRENKRKEIERNTKDKTDRQALTNLAFAGLGGFALYQLLKRK